MSNHSYTVFIDESGDEGFVFKPDGSGSRRWLILSAAIVRRKNEHELIKALKDVRETLRKPPNRHLHFTDLKHEQRIPYLRRLAATPLRTVSVLVHKPSLREPEKFQATKCLLYHYACRYLLERVSWLCRDHRVPGEGDGQAAVIFSNRSTMAYDELRDYLRLLKKHSSPLEVRIDWQVINPDLVSTKNHDQLAGLQVADAVASSFFLAAHPNLYGETEDRYARLLAPTIYRHKGAHLGYGLKFWPEDVGSLKAQNPHLAGFAELGE